VPAGFLKTAALDTTPIRENTRETIVASAPSCRVGYDSLRLFFRIFTATPASPVASQRSALVPCSDGGSIRLPKRGFVSSARGAGLTG
jgi:hypothetical protein